MNVLQNLFAYLTISHSVSSFLTESIIFLWLALYIRQYGLIPNGWIMADLTRSLSLPGTSLTM